jgi:hypothetical protein
MVPIPMNIIKEKVVGSIKASMRYMFMLSLYSIICVFI